MRIWNVLRGLDILQVYQPDPSKDCLRIMDGDIRVIVRDQPSMVHQGKLKQLNWYQYSAAVWCITDKETLD